MVLSSLTVLALLDNLLVVRAAHTVRRVEALAWANRLGRLQPWFLLAALPRLVLPASLVVLPAALF